MWAVSFLSAWWVEGGELSAFDFAAVGVSVSFAGDGFDLVAGVDASFAFADAGAWVFSR